MSAWDKVLKARAKDRPLPLDYVRSILDDFTELKGDRLYGDDQAVVAGLAFFKGKPVTVITITRGRDIEENIIRNFGSPNPEGYRKALRLMKASEKFNRPVIMFIDTKGAGCAVEAEERGQGEAIARCLHESATLKVPMISFITGEGGSGGALALASGDEVHMLENAIYSILSPEGFSSILYKNPSKAREASEIMKITAEDLLGLGIIEGIISEKGDINENLEEVMHDVSETLSRFLERAGDLSVEELLTRRYERFRSFGKVYWKAEL
ncbi:acetyl-CoA carboxylase carboxyl transferase subunit alpha [Proteiniclasticum sp. C24MP]|uniref:acetyl-CoA carboxylase carboxyl transferase subunit alpha n=1 Tax=Proteiniclasticum sp. C24MP TaxID=3374101 RepID=UPI0037550530